MELSAKVISERIARLCAIEAKYWADCQGERLQLISICAIEAKYWADCQDERLQLISIGAMGAASNICAAVLRGLSPESYREEVSRRSR